MELELILERLRNVTGQKSDRAMCLFLGLRGTISGGWKERGTIPWEACYLAEEKTGYLMKWLLTGKGPQKHTEAPSAEIDEDKLIKDFAQVVVDGVQLRFLRTTDDTTEETLEILGRKLYSLYTGEISIPKSKNYKKAV
jgi:hypothetical protein